MSISVLLEYTKKHGYVKVVVVTDGGLFMDISSRLFPQLELVVPQADSEASMSYIPADGGWKVTEVGKAFTRVLLYPEDNSGTVTKEQLRGMADTLERGLKIAGVETRRSRV